ncbi:hypothetical protein H2509_13415 [Stappia sp. F7233]|uniref:Uncharacterized protein n=1 Tax=Stappia albiluteola TaxID=2758565 RepID=A0A839AEK6_9HYPH|nr:hypothetical protein [Stappia albiluteola]MBA5777451.1 hypothetical protein [Stappia albiluteola]MBA5777489.1 hypothetical protein [Stappia albiluteola]MBA5778100.1 hypothetical protein [Stappia albiluteola]MBA5778123.1 hypothetical protein [Stappia albiluteola]
MKQTDSNLSPRSLRLDEVHKANAAALEARMAMTEAKSARDAAQQVFQRMDAIYADARDEYERAEQALDEAFFAWAEGQVRGLPQ